MRVEKVILDGRRVRGANGYDAADRAVHAGDGAKVVAHIKAEKVGRDC